MEEERLGAIELLYATELALDRHVEVVPKLFSLITEHPFREKLHALLITALYGSGRQADALEASQRLRRIRHCFGSPHRGRMADACGLFRH